MSGRIHAGCDRLSLAVEVPHDARAVLAAPGCTRARARRESPARQNSDLLRPASRSPHITSRPVDIGQRISLGLVREHPAEAARN